ncbi:hypothetical protein OJ996_19795 [Luteolibacter sp. GHJ8]|uniref:Uncharacterized protein n=1 Tax=Luteolibacter rhizosphaerae TaxID=2989719 RepID=A0ABT3G7Q9_9BACT|nr:hypothetical protein [Luteolibacter rhizosphaerae]MCW1915840.1 hypothetical protein [Luteolibacter rhizosphaerae]
MDSRRNILIRLEGLPEEEGHLRLSEFLKALEEWKKILHQFDQMESPGGRPEVYYRVVNLSHSSPATIELEPVALPRREKKLPKNQALPTYKPPKVENRPRRLMSELRSIKDKAGVSDEVDPQVLVSLKAVAPSSSNGIARSSVIYGDTQLDLDQQFSSNVSKLINSELVSHGTLDGQLEALNVHGSGPYSCYVYPPIGPKKIRCTFNLLFRKKILELADKYVRISGFMHYREKSDFPYMMELSEIEELHPSSVVKFSTLVGSPESFIDGTSPHDIDDDW